MKFLVVLVSCLFMISTYAKEVYQVSPSDTKLTWLGKKVGGQHDGVIQIKSGSITYDAGRPVSAEFVVDMSSITVKDLTGDSKANLEGHLKNTDFFEVDKYPTAKLALKKFKQAKGGQYEVMGDLTIKNKTVPINFSASVTEGKEKVSGKAKIVFDRTKFGITYKSNIFEKFKDKFIHNDVELNVSLVAKK